MIPGSSAASSVASALRLGARLVVLVSVVGGDLRVQDLRAQDECAPRLEPLDVFQVASNVGTSWIADFDRDGHLDLSVGTVIYSGDGAGGFTRELSLDDGSFREVFDQRTADMDGDGLLDVVQIRIIAESVEFLYGVGEPGAQVYLSEPVIIPVGTVTHGLFHIDIGDFDDDGRLDVVGVAFGGNQYVVLRNEGERAFSAHPLGDGKRGHMLTVGDFDGDDHDDIAVGRSSEWSIFFGKGDLAFEDELSGPIVVDGATRRGHRFRAADLDGDGRDEMIATADGDVAIYLGAEISRESGLPAEATLSLPVRGTARFIEVVDMNGDARLDIVAHSVTSSANLVRIWTTRPAAAGDPPGLPFAFDDVGETDVAFEGAVAGVLAVGDLTGDGTPDVVVTTEDSYEGRILENRGGCFSDSARSGDANKDGILNLSDAVLVLSHLFSGAELPCPGAAETNGDDILNLTDAVYLLGYLFLGGPAPVGDDFVSCTP